MNVNQIFFFELQGSDFPKFETGFLNQIDRLLPVAANIVDAKSKIDPRKETWKIMSDDLKKLMLRDACMRWPTEFDSKNLLAYMKSYDQLPFDGRSKLFDLMEAQGAELARVMCAGYQLKAMAGSYQAAKQGQRGAAA